jgi:glycosyltransferase involved in cell wall biosynthesis
VRPAVSVIVPCYNAAATVTRALDSLAGQTLKDLEIIAVNDGSTDQTPAILAQYAKDHPDLCLKIFSTANQGIAATRNFALQQVSGRYFGFLDADDYTAPDMYQDLYQLAQKDHLQLAVSDFLWVNSKGEKRQSEGPYQVGPEMMVHLFATLWNKLYDTDFIRSLDIRFPDGCRYEDACFLYCLTCRLQRIGFVSRPYVHYVQQQQSITHTNNDQVKNMITVFQIIQKYYRDHGCYEQYHDALEYIHIKFFLGNSFLRSSKIADPEDRRRTIRMGWDLLNREFPEWHRNRYLQELGGMKNRYFAMVNENNVMFFAWLFHTFGKDNL